MTKNKIEEKRRFIDNSSKNCWIRKFATFFSTLNWTKTFFNFSISIIKFSFFFNISIRFFNSSTNFAKFSNWCCVSRTIRCNFRNCERVLKTKFDVIACCKRQIFIFRIILIRFVNKTKNIERRRRSIFSNSRIINFIRFLKRSKNYNDQLMIQ